MSAMNSNPSIPDSAWSDAVPGEEGPTRKPASIRIDGTEVKPGDRVRLQPNGRADILDLALTGKVAQIMAIEQDWEDRVYLAVTVEDDPGKDLGEQGKPGHRFYFRPDEVRLLGNTGEK